MKKTLTVSVISIPALLFLVSRMTSFFNDVWAVGINSLLQWLIFAAALIVVIASGKKIYDFLSDFAYGFTSPAIMIYILSALVCIKYKGVFLTGCAGGGLHLSVGAGVLLGVFVLLFAKSIDVLLQKIIRHRPKKKDWLFILISALVLNLQAVIYCLFMKKIFVWDNAGYFTTAHELSRMFPSMEYLKAVYQSIFATDYNYIIAIPASILCKLFGNSRLVFVLSIINFYVVPLVSLIYAISKIVFKKSAPAVFAVLFLPYMIFAANTGFVDIGGAVLALVAFVLFVRGESVHMSLLSGICLAICVLLRRWYSFYALSFIIMSFVYGISNKKLKDSIAQLCSFAFVLLFFAQPFVSGKLMADYKDMYSAYALGLMVDIKLFTRYFGLLAVVMCSLWAVWSQIKSGRKAMTVELFALCQGALCFVLFTSVQTHGQQHLALYLPAFIIIALSMLSWEKKYMCALVCIVCALNTASTFIPRVQPQSVGEIKRVSLLPTFSMYPPVDVNAESFLPVCEYMDKEIGEKGKTVCFLASSLQMNYDTLKNAEVSLSVRKKSDIDRKTYYIPIGDVDKRDGLMSSLFECDYILVPSKLQLHLAPEEQEVIAQPYEQIMGGYGIGTAYEKQEKIFSLASGDEIYVYERIRDITPEEIEIIKTAIK